MKKLAPILVFGIPAIIFVLLAYKGFEIHENALVAVSMVFAVMCVLGCWLVIVEVNRKDKELAERKIAAERAAPPPAPENTDTPPEKKKC